MNILDGIAFWIGKSIAEFLAICVIIIAAVVIALVVEVITDTKGKP